MITLTEFLLARIAEDEATAQEVKAIDDDVTTESEAFSNDHHHYGFNVGMSATRMLAECEAKRRIVERSGAYQEPTDESAVWDRWDQGWAVAMEGVLPLLALPYADHPDYRQEWRP